MNPLGKILIVDDDPLFRETYEDVLGKDGYEVAAAVDRETALRQLEAGPDVDVVLLDMKLHGGEGPNDGLDLFSEIQVRAPFAKIIVVTGFAERHPIKEAFAAGAYDFMAKQGPQFQALLQAKVRNALDLVRERRLAALGQAEFEAVLEETYADVWTEKNPHRKGALLEQLMVLLFKTIPGFGGISARRRNDIEEIDLVIPNESRDPVWQKEGSYLLGECKNWSHPVGRPEFDAFRSKLQRKFGRCRLGFFVAPGGFSEPFLQAHREYSHSPDHIVIVPIGPEGLARLVQASDRNTELRRLHEQAVLSSNGDHSGS
jgi:CheY-like chemotaxis protein